MDLYKKPSKFPFLFLPIIVIENALRNLDPIELINFSQISKRCHKIIKYSTKKNPFELKLDFCFSPRITVDTGKQSYNMVPSMFLEGFDVNSDKYGCLRVFWSARWTEYILDALNCKINKLTIKSEECFYSFSFIVDWFSTTKHCLEYATFEGRAIISEHLKLFLEACKTTRAVIILLEQSYEIDHFELESLQMDYIQIDGRTHALNWITMTNIMHFDCLDLLLGEFAFTEQEMNTFLRLFIEGSILPRMRYFRIELLPMNLQLLKDGIEVVERERTVVREFIHIHSMFSFKFHGGTDIRLHSGKLATFKQLPPPNPLDPNCKACFIMVVW